MFQQVIFSLSQRCWFIHVTFSTSSYTFVPQLLVSSVSIPRYSTPSMQSLFTTSVALSPRFWHLLILGKVAFSVPVYVQGIVFGFQILFLLIWKRSSGLFPYWSEFAGSPPSNSLFSFNILITFTDVTEFVHNTHTIFFFCLSKSVDMGRYLLDDTCRMNSFYMFNPFTVFHAFKMCRNRLYMFCESVSLSISFLRFPVFVVDIGQKFILKPIQLTFNH